MLSFWKRRDNNEKKEGSLRVPLTVIALIAGVALLLFGDRIPRADTEAEDGADAPVKDELMLYQDYLEERVRTLCESVDGVGDVTAVVSLSGGFEQIYATEVSEDGEAYVVIGSGSKAEALLIGSAAPEIAGIGIVCRGGGSPTVKQELTDLLGAAFHISSHRIYITEAKK